MEALVYPIYDCFYRFCKLIGKHTGYVRHLEENTNSLKKEKVKLVEIRNDVQRKVRFAEERNLQPLDQVCGWLQRVEQMESQVDIIIGQAEVEIQHKCYFGYHPKNLWSIYKLGMKISLKLPNVLKLKGEGNFEVVTDMLPRAQVNEMPVEKTVGLDEKFEEIWSCIMDPVNNIIGICGMGGVGKTTLIKKVNNKLASQIHYFDMVIWIVVSKDSNIEMIQDKLGKKLGYNNDTWREKCKDDKASDILSILKKKKVVLLLDDLWEGLNLTEVGIPLSDDQNNKTKILFTTRQEDVCGLMEANKLIKIEPLQWSESWKLFKTKVGEEIINSHPQICNLAEEVARSCGGLPLALITVGRTMASKRTPQEWEHSITTLKSTSKFSSMEEKVLSILKFSYDNLSDETIKRCFLYCSLFPEDYEICYDFELIPLWIGEGFFDECDTASDAENLGHDIIGRLKLGCLLESAGLEDDCVKLHDMIRDMGLWIITDYGKNNNRIFVGNSVTSKALTISRWDGAERISLQKCEIEDVDITPNCPNLLTLLICFNRRLEKISNTFFRFATSLKVLNLSHNPNLTELPKSLGELSSLQYLSLSYTKIRELPLEFKNFSKLKFLYLRQMEKLIMPLNVIPSLSMLERLDLFATGSSSSDGALLDELECLSHLQVTGVKVESELAFQKFLSSKKLQRVTRYLAIKLFKGLTSLELSSLLKLKGLTRVEIDRFYDLKEVIIDWSLEKEQIETLIAAKEVLWNSMLIMRDNRRCFFNLRNLSIYHCRKLTNLTCLVDIPSLEILYVGGCHAVEDIIIDCETLDPFSRIKSIRLIDLPELKSFCRHTLPFPLLNIVIVSYCPKLRKLPFGACSSMSKLKHIYGQRNWRDKLIWEDESSRSIFSPYFGESGISLAKLRMKKLRLSRWNWISEILL